MRFFFTILIITFCGLISTEELSGWSGGGDGVTTGKTSVTSAGCSGSGCHGTSSTSTSLTRTSGSTSVNAGSTTTFTVQVAHSSQSAAGINIAVKSDETGSTNAGTLAESDNDLQMFSGEITHSSPRSLSGGSVSYTFTWTAPTAAGTYYLRAVGNAVNNNNSSSGDNWNWMTPVAITVNALPTLSLTAPASSAIWCPNTSQNITWNSTGVSTIKIEISPDGSNYTTIASSVAASAGTYSYLVPANTPSGTQYRIRLTDNSNSTLTSTSAVFSVGGAGAISTQPASQSVCPGQPVIFTVAASGAGNTYQWYKDGQPVSGATSASYSIPAVAPANAGRYHVVVSNVCASPLTSADAILTVGTPTIITNSPPATQTVCINQAVVLTVSATGANLSYQWNRNGVALPGETNASLTVTVAGAQQEGNYTATVTGTCGTQNSSPSAIVAGFGPTISAHPTAQNSLIGGTAVFSVSAANVNTYQWRKNGLDITGATTATLTITNVKQSDTGSYDVRIVNNCGAMVSTSAKLLILQPGAGAIFTASTLTLDFGNTQTDTPIGRTLVITNTGDSTLKVNSATISETDAAKYSIATGGAPFEIAPNGTHTILINLSSATAGTFTANVNFESNAKSNPTILLTGTVKSPESPVLTIENVRFDTTNVGVTTTKSVKIQNVGTMPSLVSSLVIEGANVASFSLPDQFSQITLGAGESLDINVDFTPLAEGEATATLRVVAEGGDLTAQLSGYGKALSSVNNPEFIHEIAIAPNPVTENAVIKVTLDKAVMMEVQIVDVHGRIVRTLQGMQLMESGAHSFTWNRTNDAGSRVSGGMYRVVLRGMNSVITMPLIITN